MKIAYGSDEITFVTTQLALELKKIGHEILELPQTDWAQVGTAAGQMVTKANCDLAIVWCWTGTGVCMAANKVQGARAALCGDSQTAQGAKRWNDANVLALSIRLTSLEIAIEITKSFLETQVDEKEIEIISKIR